MTKIRDAGEVPLWGWRNLARVLGLCERAAKNRRKELLEAAVIFYQYQGRPPHRNVGFYESVIKAWKCQKTMKGEMT